METMELGALLVGVSLFVLLGMAFPVVLLVTAGFGLVLMLLGYLEREEDAPSGQPDLVECPNCRGLESPERSTCRFCDESLAGTRSESVVSNAARGSGRR